MLKDFRAGVISLEAARDVYGVEFVEGNQAVDAAGTQALRDRIYAARLQQEAAE